LLQETIKPNISNKSKNILGIDRVEQFMQRRNVGTERFNSSSWFAVRSQFYLTSWRYIL